MCAVTVKVREWGHFGVLSNNSRFSVKVKKTGVPSETKHSFMLGNAVHLGPSLIFSLLLLLNAPNWWLLVGSFLALSVVNLIFIVLLEERSPAVDLPKRTFKAWSEGLSLVFLKGVLSGSLVVFIAWALLNSILGEAITINTDIKSGALPTWLLIIAAVCLTDFCYYWIHRELNHGKGKSRLHKWFQKKHVTHHSVEVLDFLRGNISSFFDTAVTGFQVPLAIISVLLGLDLYTTLIVYALVLMLQATHHANHTFNIGWLRFIFMDNHAHKLHHCPRGYLVNHGALFSLWDQAFGTYYEDWQLSANYLQKHRIPLPLSVR
ncbi:MAG: sterol desaturase family protein [Pseudomonadales bacterium]|nr:sterol desaturase family protein [Pseudomonadales bacterium]